MKDTSPEIAVNVDEANDADDVPTQECMRPLDPFLFLIGHRGAIQRIAGTWWSLLVGLILVITAGIARNYDHLSMTSTVEWWLGPIVASLMSCIVVSAIGLGRYFRGKTYWMSWLTFLSCYWMTAPCAWIYGIPVEAYTDIYTATQWNIAFLTIVSIWRVVLMARVLVVLSGTSVFHALGAILVPASAVMFLGAFFKGISLVGVMGGVRLSPHTQLLRDAANFTVLASIGCFFVGLFCVSLGRKALQGKNVKVLQWRGGVSVPTPALAFAVGILMGGFLAVQPVQKKVERNAHLSRLIRAGDFAGAVAYASQFEEKDFSRIHFLPPSPDKGYIWNKPKYDELLSYCDDSTPQWIVDAWTEQKALEKKWNFAKRERYGMNKEEAEKGPESEQGQKWRLPTSYSRVWVMSADWEGYMGVVIALSEGRYYYWMYSDVGGTDPSGPYRGAYSIEDGELQLGDPENLRGGRGKEELYSRRWKMVEVGGEVRLLAIEDQQRKSVKSRYLHLDREFNPWHPFNNQGEMKD